VISLQIKISTSYSQTYLSLSLHFICFSINVFTYCLLLVWMVIADGLSLQHALNPQVVDRFMDLTRLCDSVLVCRASPGQKEDVVNTVRRHLGPIRTCAVGDG
jgi:magnesium-transporting ATPase (P-type)